MMNAEYFMEYLNYFAEEVKATEADPVILVVDGHSSRMQLHVWLHALSKHVKLFILPGGITSHIYATPRRWHLAAGG